MGACRSWCCDVGGGLVIYVRSLLGEGYASCCPINCKLPRRRHQLSVKGATTLRADWASVPSVKLRRHSIDSPLSLVPQHDSMSASQIPNLNALRPGRSGIKGRGRGRGGLGGGGGGDDDERQAKDRIVQQTDQDASVSRMSAVELGYLEDEFAKDFVQEATQRRFPIINRGSSCPGYCIFQH